MSEWDLAGLIRVKSDIEFSNINNFQGHFESKYFLQVSKMENKFDLRPVAERFYVGLNCFGMDVLCGVNKWRLIISGLNTSKISIFYKFPFFMRTVREQQVWNMALKPLLDFLFLREKLLLVNDGKQFHVLKEKNETINLKSLNLKKFECLNGHDFDEPPFRFFLQCDQNFGTNYWEEFLKNYEEFIGK